MMENYVGGGEGVGGGVVVYILAILETENLVSFLTCSFSLS